jgi:hypothetical protein
MFIEAGPAVDIARAVDLVTTEGKKRLRKVLEKARMIAKSPTTTVNVFAVVEYDGSVVVERCSPGVSDITKEDFLALKVPRALYSC